MKDARRIFEWANEQRIEQVEADYAHVSEIHREEYPRTPRVPKAETSKTARRDYAARMSSPEASEPGRFEGRGIFFWQRAPRTSTTSAPRRYRIGNWVELLRGVTAVVRSRPDKRLFGGARVLICVRFTLDRQSRRLLEALRAEGVFLVSDFDDLLFDECSHEFPDVLSGKLSLERASQIARHYRDGLALFDAFTVSTEELAGRLREVTNGARVRVVPNGISTAWWEQGRLLYPAPSPKQPRVIRYLPGSAHDHDFALLEEPLGRFLRRHPDVRLEVLGPFGRFPVNLPRERCRRFPRVPFRQLPEFLSSSWVTLAPLAPGRFNRAKSALKFLESAAFGTPCIATPIPDMMLQKSGGVLLADTASEWEAALEDLCDEAHYRTIADRGRAWVAQQGTARHGVQALLSALREWTGGRT